MDQLDSLRQEIDELDRQLVALFLRRMEVTGRVGAYKQARGLPVMDPGREQAVVDARAAQAPDPARRADVAALYAAIMGISRRQQRQLVREEDGAALADYRSARALARVPVENPRVVYQGEPGAYSEAAARGFFGPAVHSEGLPWFGDVFQALRDKRADYAVLPVENSSTGSIRQVYDLLAQFDCYIVGEYEVKVEHCLMALPGVALEEIQTVYSHEQGLMQCEQYLDAHRAWTRVPTLDTAGSARQVAHSGDRTAAAICSRRAAELYGLHILAEGINHNGENRTRFVVVSPVMELRPGRDKISAVFHLPHQSGSLHEILTIFTVQGLNLVKLESRPIPGRGFKYLFFLEFTGDLEESGMEGVLRELAGLSTGFRVLGNFKTYVPAKAAPRNLVLIGMPGSGKTTVAQRLGACLGRPVLDTDLMVEKRAGRRIPDIFALEGEQAFRALESEAVAQAAGQGGVVIATGGGVVLDSGNMQRLAEQGFLVFLDRPPEDIAACDHSGRPLIGGARDRVFELYSERLPLYRRYADYTAQVKGTPEAVTEQVMAAYQREVNAT